VPGILDKKTKRVERKVGGLTDRRHPGAPSTVEIMTEHSEFLLIPAFLLEVCAGVQLSDHVVKVLFVIFDEVRIWKLSFAA
jgi:hypothetical protein